MAKPNLALIPATIGDKVYSILPSDGVGDFDFTRASTGTRINAQGLIETVDSGVSRLNYPMIDGVVSGCPHHILEPQRSNLFTQSETFSNWSNSQSTETINSGISPDGSNAATKIKPTTSSSVWSGLNSPSISITSGTDYTFSLFAKKDEYSYVQVGGSTPRFNGSFSTIDLSNGTVVYESGINANVESYGNEWYRISFTQTAVSSGTGIVGFIAVYNYAPNSRLQAFGGDGSSGILVWGCQLEIGSYPTSYIPTSGTAVTRAAETCNGSGNAATFNDSEGVLFADIAYLETQLSPNSRVAISDGTTANRLLIQNVNSTANRLQFYVIVSSSTQADFYTNLSDIKLFNKIAFKYKSNDFSVWINGFEVLTDTSGNTFSNGTLSELNFDGGDGNNDFYGKTKQIQYFYSALTDTELEQLTSWDSFRAMAEGQLYTIE
jgi:hypothetical protein